MVVQTRVTQALRVRPEAAASSSRGGQPVAAMEIQDDTESRPRAALQAFLRKFPAQQVKGMFRITELIEEGPAQEACSRISSIGIGRMLYFKKLLVQIFLGGSLWRSLK